MCTNTEGSYVCRCRRGYDGDGRNCTGKHFWFVLIFQLLLLPFWRVSKCFCMYLHCYTCRKYCKVKYPMIDKCCSHVWVFLSFHFQDVDECDDAESNECDASALCTNTEGSFVCRCLVGYEGDGRTCIGKDQYFYSETSSYRSLKSKAINHLA